MAIQTNSYVMSTGLKLNRIYDDNYYPGASSCDSQCGDLALWGQYMQELSTNSQEYYNQSNGTNKFFRCVVVNVYSRFVPFPNAQTALALCYSRGSQGQLPPFNSQIDIQYFDPTVNAYRFPAALSHEMGHAYHNWCGVFGQDTVSPEICHFIEKLVSTNHTTNDPTKFPWKQDNGWVEGPWEQFANAYRYFMGTNVTRGSSGPGTPDNNMPGFEDPANHQDWKKMLQLLPELCSMIKAYGVKPNTLEWRGWYFYFQMGDGTWVYQDNYFTNGWHRWNGTQWVLWVPIYTRV